MAYGAPPPIGGLPRPTVPNPGALPALPSPTQRGQGPGVAYGQSPVSLLTAAQSILAVSIATHQTLLRIEAVIARQAGQPNQQPVDKQQRQSDPFGLLSRAIAGVATVGTALAHNSGVGMASGALHAAAQVLPGMVGRIAGAFGALVTAASVLTNAFVERGKELAKYSATISIAQAQSSARQQMADIREAQMLGDSYGRLIQEQTDAILTVREAILPIKQVVMTQLIDLLQDLNAFLKSDFFRGLAKGTEASLNITGAIRKFVALDFTGAWKELDKAAKNIEDIANNTKPPPPKFRDLMGELLKQHEINLFGNDHPSDQFEGGANGLKIPIVRDFAL